MALSIVQSQAAILGMSFPAGSGITLGATPTAGNLVLVGLHCNVATANITVNTGAGWVDLKDAITGSNTNGMVLGRIVQGGDTTTLPDPWTAGNSYWAYELYEIGGGSTTLADNIQDIKADTGASAIATLDPAAITTLTANCLALLLAGQYDGNADPTLDASFTTDFASHNFILYGSQASGHQAVPTLSTVVSANTVTYNVTSGPADAFLVMLQASVPAGGATGSGSIGTETETAPTGSGVQAQTGSGSIGTETETAPTGVGKAGSTGAGSLGTETETAPTGAGIDHNIAQGNIGTETETAPSVDAFGSGEETRTTQVTLKVLTADLDSAHTTQAVLKVLFTEQERDPPATSLTTSTMIQASVLPSESGDLEEAFPCPWPAPTT